MKHLRIAFFFIGIIFSINIQAQQNHFIYLQTENKQPFYLKLNNQVYSSTLSGYLILSKLKVGVYTFYIGFPKKEWPEQIINCAVEDKDYGYLLKLFNDKRWGLFNLQTLNILMAEEVQKKIEPEAAFKSDAFSTMLSTVVNDPSIKQIEPATIPIKQTESQNIADKSGTLIPISIEKKGEPKIVQTDSILIASQPKENIRDSIVSINIEKDLPKVAIRINDVEPVGNLSAITRSKLSKTKKGTELVYVETTNGIKDTIKLFIPSDKGITDKKTFPTEAIPNINADMNISPAINSGAAAKSEAKFLAIDLPNKAIGELPAKVDSTTTSKAIVELPAKVDSPISKVVVMAPVFNSDCKNMASNEDFLKLRKKMAGENHADNMIVVAKKTFKLKCFATEQIRNLSVLFLKDMDKYNFFDVAYPFVSDAQNFPVLQSQLTDTYYIDRFKVMIRH